MASDEGSEKARLTSQDFSPQATAIAILSADHAVLSWNHGIENLTGYSLQALDHLNLLELFEPPKTLNEVLHRVYAGESPASLRMRLRTANGRHLPVEVQCGPLPSLDGSKTPIMLLIRELVPRQERRHPEARLALLEHLAGEMSHEIRNPMNAIFLHVDIVEEEVGQLAPGDCTQVVQSLATIKAELTRLHGLIQDYLFLARLSDLRRAPTDLRALVEDLLYEIHPQCALRGIAIVPSGLDEVGEVALHQSSFRRALLTTLQLLIEASPSDATLTLGVRRTSCHVQLEIHDLNKAIPPEVWAALPLPMRGGGTPGPADLRLYVAQEIITAHGGEIAVSDDANVGMLCTITLPLDIME